MSTNSFKYSLKVLHRVVSRYQYIFMMANETVLYIKKYAILPLNEGDKMAKTLYCKLRFSRNISRYCMRFEP